MNIVKKKGKREETIVFIHGNSSSSRVFNKIFTENELPFNLISFDLPGHGKSPHNNEYSFEIFKGASLDLIRNIERDVLLIGHSLGGHLALEIAQEIPNLKGLVISGAPPFEKPMVLNEVFLPNPNIDTLFSENPSEDDIKKLLNSIVKNKTAIPIIKDDLLLTDSKVRSALAVDLSKEETFLDEKAIFLSLPVKKFIIHGEDDSLINLNYLHKLKHESNNSFDILMIKDCGHYPTIEQPEKFLQHLLYISIDTFQEVVQ